MKACSGGGGEVECWKFEEDAYTLGINALVLTGMPGAAPHVLLALVMPMFQGFVFFTIWVAIARKNGEHGEVGTMVKVLCCLLAAMPLSSEVLEGLRKSVFSLRAYNGTYLDVKSVNCMKTGFVLGICQALMGICSFSLCLSVVSTASNVMDAFMNFVALGFIADMDNMLMSCKVVREYVRCTPEVTLQVNPNPSAPFGVVPRHTLVVINGVSAVMLLFLLGVNIVAGAEHEPPLEFAWLEMLPAGAAVWIALNLALRLGCERDGPVRASVLVMAACVLAEAADAAKRLSGGEPLFSPLIMGTLFSLGWILPLGGLAVEHSMTRLLPPFAVLGLAQACLGTFNCWHYGQI